jgi:hypothetical protein
MFIKDQYEDLTAYHNWFKFHIIVMWDAEVCQYPGLSPKDFFYAICGI